MSRLFDNAVHSIRLGLEDYQAEDPARTLSAVRNFYAGLLLLAKEVLVRAVPEADEKIVLAANYKPRPDGFGGIEFVPQKKATIDLHNIGARFKDFGLHIDDKALDRLSQIRNDVEHRFPDETHDVTREVIAKAFPVAYQLFRQAGEEPHVVLEDAWTTMLDVRTIYKQELKECSMTFDNIDWYSDFMATVHRVCPECRSDLVAQTNSDNRDQQEIKAECRSCGARFTAERLIEKSVAVHFDNQAVPRRNKEIFLTYDPVQTCPECGLVTYVIGGGLEEEIGCVWCECKLGECIRCEAKLTPDDVGDRSDLCSYCDYQWSKLKSE